MDIRIVITITIISAILCIRTFIRFFNDKITTEWSFEYLIFGYCGFLIFIFGIFVIIYKFFILGV